MSQRVMDDGVWHDFIALYSLKWSNQNTAFRMKLMLLSLGLSINAALKCFKLVLCLDEPLSINRAN